MTPRFASEIEQLLADLCREHGLAAPALEWSVRMRRMLGLTYYAPPVIRLSAWLEEGQARETLRHELAHIAVHASMRRGSKREPPHGAQWREWVRRLGAEPRALAKSPPAFAPQSTSARATGLECAGCGARFVRRRVERGLYHTDCGPGKGALRTVLRDEAEAVRRWAMHANC